MKLGRSLLLLFGLAVSLALTSSIAAQSQAFRVSRILPYDKAVPGQIMQLLVEGLAGGAGPLMLPAEDFKLTVSQDGVSQPARIRLVVPLMMSNRRAAKETGGAVDSQMHAYQSVSFVVPQGLHPGEAELMLAYRGQTGNTIGLTIVEKPLRPLVGSLGVMTINASSLPPPPGRIEDNNLGWRLERGATTQLTVQPTVDPDDPNSAVLVRFKQGENHYDATARLTSKPSQVVNRDRGVGFFPPRDILEVDVPAALEMGPVELEIRVRANGQESDSTPMRATISDSGRSVESPLVNAPRLLLVTPSRVGVGQSLMLSVDYRRTLEPDTAKTLVAIEQGNARYLLEPENSSATFDRNRAPDAPVLVFVRTTGQIVGKAQVRIFNELRGQQTGMSEPVPIEIVSEPVAPQLLAVRESTETDLAPLRQMYELQSRAGGKFPDFDPQRKYLTVNVKGIDFNPRYVRITLTQGERTFTLAPQDFSLYTNDTLIVRQPRELKAGPVKFVIQNRGGDLLSAPVSETFELCCIP